MTRMTNSLNIKFNVQAVPLIQTDLTVTLKKEELQAQVLDNISPEDKTKVKGLEIVNAVQLIVSKALKAINPKVVDTDYSVSTTLTYDFTGVDAKHTFSIVITATTNVNLKGNTNLLTILFSKET